MGESRFLRRLTRRVREALPGLALLCVIPLVAADSVAAQSMSTFQSSRSFGGESELTVQVRYGAGTFRLGPGDPGLLYQAVMEYDEEVSHPISDYSNGRLTVGVEDLGGRGRFTVRREARGELDLRLGTQVPTDLRLELGAVRTEVDLGGIPLEQLEFTTGASETDLRVSAPNPTSMERVAMKVGAASFRARELGNLNAQRFEVEAGVGDVRLDFSGRWSSDATVRISMGMGSLELQVPQELGVRLSRSTFLTSLDADDFVRRGGDYYSPNWDEAEHQLHIDVSAALGNIRVRRNP